MYVQSATEHPIVIVPCIIVYEVPSKQKEGCEVCQYWLQILRTYLVIMNLGEVLSK